MLKRKAAREIVTIKEQKWKQMQPRSGAEPAALLAFIMVPIAFVSLQVAWPARNETKNSEDVSTIV